MVLTPRRVALAAAEALAEGLLGLPVKEDELAEVLVVARGAQCQRRKFPLLCFIVAYQCSWWWKTCRLSVSSSVRSRVKGRRRRRKAEIAEVRSRC
jgi:hypothetical protein